MQGEGTLTSARSFAFSGDDALFVLHGCQIRSAKSGSTESTYAVSGLSGDAGLGASDCVMASVAFAMHRSRSSWSSRDAGYDEERRPSYYTEHAKDEVIEEKRSGGARKMEGGPVANNGERVPGQRTIDGRPGVGVHSRS